MKKLLFSWLVVLSVCQFFLHSEAACAMASAKKAKRFCTKVYKRAQPSLQACASAMKKSEKNTFKSFCIGEYCRLGSGVACNMYESFVKDCIADGFNISETTWRKETKCPESGVFVTTPDQWVVGQEVNICVDFHNIKLETDVKVTVFDDDDVELSKKRWRSLKSSTCLTFPVPSCTNNEFLDVNYTINNDYYLFEEKVEVKCRKFAALTFIQPDKPIYKAGQTVAFRIMTVDLPDLKPISSSISQVYIEDPGESRVAQWDDIPTELGLAELSLPLSEHPVLGKWTIFVNTGEVVTKQTFKVEEFVLPRWDFNIKIPKYVQDGQNATFTLCAKYTYGENVQGTFEASVCALYPPPCITFSGSIDGCTDVVVGSFNFDYFRKYRTIKMNASVTEGITGNKLKAEQQIYIQGSGIVLKFHPQMSKYYKPGFTVIGQLLVKYLDGRPAPGVIVNLTRVSYAPGKIYGPYTSSTTGVIDFIIPSDDFRGDMKSGYIRAATEATSEFGDSVSVYHYLSTWYSPDNNFIVIAPPFIDPLPCSGVFTFTVYYTHGYRFTYAVIAKGKIVLQDQVKDLTEDAAVVGGVAVNVLSLDVPMSAAMSGKAQLLVFQITETSNFIADVLFFDVQGCLPNKVTFEFDKERGKPGETVKYTVAADGRSLCSVNVIDKSLDILAGNKFLTKQKVMDFQSVLNLFYNYKQFDDHSYCTEWLKDEGDNTTSTTTPSYDYCYGYGYSYTSIYAEFYDATLGLKQLGLAVASDVHVQSRPCKTATNYYCYYYYDYYDTSTEASTTQTTTTSPPPTTTNPSVLPGAPTTAAPTTTTQPPPQPPPEDEIRKFFPETFLWDLVVIPKKKPYKKTTSLPDTITEWFGNAVCTNKETGLGVSDLASVTTFLDFFITLDLPYSVVRGESVIIPVLIYNYMDTCHLFAVRLFDQSGFDLLSPSEQTVYVCSQQSGSVDYIIRPTALGEIDLTAGATWVFGTAPSDAITKKLLVEPEGIEMSYSIADYMCAPYSFSAELPLPSVYIAGSERGQVSVMGDIMGMSISNLERLIRLPSGCGEQTMSRMAPLVYAMQYLTAVNQITSETEARATSFMQKGYQKMLTFKTSAGSYGTWPGQSTGNFWLTVFVVKVLAQADQFIYIDTAEQTETINWIINEQKTDGCFPVVHYTSYLAGGLYYGDDPVAITAYTVISILEAGLSAANAAVGDAIGCLDNADITTKQTYPLALLAYAYALYDSTLSRFQDIMNELNTRAIQNGDLKHWAETDVDPPITYIYYYRPPAADIEITSYVLLAMMKADGTGATGPGLPIVRWLVAQRNSFGGYRSTQDTVMGLQALSKYAALVHVDTGGVDVTVTPPGVTFSVTAVNSLVVQTNSVPVPGTVDIVVSGSGCAIVQLDVWYNVWPIPDADEAFSIQVTPAISVDCKTAILATCVRYLRSDGPTNMALVQVKMVSGWIADTVPSPAQVTDLAKVENEDNMVTFYFDKLTDVETCFDMTVVRKNIVQNVLSAPAVVLDYYKPEKSTSTSYSLSC